MPDYATEVAVPAPYAVEVSVPAIFAVEVAAGVRGPQGPPGESSAFEYTPPAPAATWTIPHSFGRRPNVAVYIADEHILVSYHATSTTVVIEFPNPQTGVAVLT